MRVDVEDSLFCRDKEIDPANVTPESPWLGNLASPDLIIIAKAEVTKKKAVKPSISTYLFMPGKLCTSYLRLSVSCICRGFY